ncbi:hypothetical protein Q4F19_17780 [Sphingomonas sp. BIUV-7]|uniref:BioF2-like acetyltransferase domain-containing protein n=2 Tax=Sphingomonas natans TaxID=3063330 RepID=A0ABT8YD01_9SPHN|nr:hypothetical protein [Sphingomonas sp. BIUV-7]
MDTAPWSHGSAEADSQDRPVFLQDWWVDAACRNVCSTVDINAGSAESCEGWLRYIIYRNKIGLRLGVSPFWTHLGGPVLRSGLSSDRQRHTIRHLVSELPSDVSMRFVCDSNSDYAAIVRDEFMAAGFSLTLLPTYLNQPGDSDILSRMKSRHRAQIRAAANEMTIQDIHPDHFIRFYRHNLPSRSHSPLVAAHQLLSEGIARGQAHAIVAINMREPCSEGMPDAAIACVWDRNRYYYWLSTRRRPSTTNASKPNPEATKLLILAAVDRAAMMGLEFDADSPETAGGRALFAQILRFRRIEHRLVFTRHTLLNKAYNQVTRRIKETVKSAFPRARVHVPIFGEIER